MLVVNADTKKFISPIAVYHQLAPASQKHVNWKFCGVTLVFEENIDIELKSFRVNLDDWQ